MHQMVLWPAEFQSEVVFWGAMSGVLFYVLAKLSWPCCIYFLMHCISLNLSASKCAPCMSIFPFMNIWTESMFMAYYMYKTVNWAVYICKTVKSCSLKSSLYFCVIKSFGYVIPFKKHTILHSYKIIWVHHITLKT